MAIEVYVCSRAKLPGTRSGDAYWYAESGAQVWVAVTDGLGSGPEAARASQAAVDCLASLLPAPPAREPGPGEAGMREPGMGEAGMREPGPGEAGMREPGMREAGLDEAHPQRLLEHVVRKCDRALRGTRGAALGLALLDAAKREGYYAGVGNVEIRVIGHPPQHPIGVPGIVGAGLRRLHVRSFAYEPGDLVLLHSDGMSSHFDLDRARVGSGTLETLGEALVRDHGHAHDDMTLLLVRHVP